MFCGDACTTVVEEQVKTIFESREIGGQVIKKGRKNKMKDPQQCSLIFRGHINMYDYVQGFNNVIAQSSNLKHMTFKSSTNTIKVDPSHLQSLHRVFFISFLREPIARAVSEFRHITEGIVAQFGPV